MSSPKASISPAIFWNILITATVFFLVPAIIYSSPVFGTKAQIVQTLLLSIAYAYLYTRASFNWRADPKAGFLNTSWMISAAAKSKIPWLRIGNSLVYSTLTVIILLMALYLAGLIMVHLYLFVLDGVRGAMPPPDSRSTGVVLVQVIVAGQIMELVGKTEDQPKN